MKFHVSVAALVVVTAISCNEAEVANERTVGSVLGSNSIANTKLLKNKLALNQAESFNLAGSLPTVSLASAKGRVAGCIDELTTLSVDGLDVSVQVPLECSNEQIILDQVVLSFEGFNGKVKLQQGVPVFVSEAFGNVMLKGFTVLRVGGTLKKSVQIDIGGKAVNSSIIIDGSDLACEDVNVGHSAGKLNITLVGMFPTSAQNEQSANLTYAGTTVESPKTHARWNAPLPTSEVTSVYDGKLKWSQSGTEKFCAFNVIAKFTGSNASGIDSDEPSTQINTCDPANADYQSWDRLDVPNLIPAICGADECLMISTTTGSNGNPIITAARCY